MRWSVLLRAAAALVFAARLGAAPPPLVILAPTELRTERDVVHVLARTEPGVTARVQGVDAAVYATGVFVRDRVPLIVGRNVLRVEVIARDGDATLREIEVERVLPVPAQPLPTDRLFIDAAGSQPKGLWRLAEGEAVEVAFSGTPGLVAEARLHERAPWQRLDESAAAPGRYGARLVLRGEADSAPALVQLRLSLPADVKRWPGRRLARKPSERSISAASSGQVGLWHSQRQRLFVVSAESAEATWGVHEVRLGGPNLAELPRGTLLVVTGQQDDRYRIALAPDVIVWVPVAALEPAAAGTRLPRPVFTSLSVAGSADSAGDVVALPWPATLPATVSSTLAGDGRPAIDIELFGTHHASTWITHRAGRTLVREVSAESAGRERVRVRVLLERAPLWGWRVERDAGVMRLIVLPPPRVQSAGASPLAGLTIAIEAGHGGPTNLGAVGATGVPEKDINRWTGEALKSELEAAGARVVMVREGDDNPGLRERAQRVLAGGAQLFVSVHANSTDPRGGYLRVGGASTYYKHPQGRDLAAAIQRRLLDDTGLADFGLVGNFNYAPIRLVTAMPAVLVEQAFVSNPEDEAKLLDPAFRARLARAVRAGIEDHLRTSRGGP